MLQVECRLYLSADDIKGVMRSGRHRSSGANTDMSIENTVDSADNWQ